jgi:hypothetical protein
MKRKYKNQPIENHKTAAYYNIDRMKPVSQVPKPTEMGIENAKEHVDNNEK